MGIAAWRFAPNQSGGFATALQGAARGSEPGLVGDFHLEPVMIGTRLGSLASMHCNFGIRANGENWGRITPYDDWHNSSIVNF